MPGYPLQQNSGFATTNWANMTNTVSVVGTNNQVIASPLTGSAFFRLSYP